MEADRRTQKLRRRDILRWPHLMLRGAIELLRARFATRSIRPGDIEPRNLAAQQRAEQVTGYRLQNAEIQRIAFVLTHVSRLVPWRSDCLPQAIAAQNWLASKGVASQIRIGVDNPEGGEFGAHAWLAREEEIVIGGDIERFAVLIGKSD